MNVDSLPKIYLVFIRTTRGDKNGEVVFHAYSDEAIKSKVFSHVYSRAFNTLKDVARSSEIAQKVTEHEQEVIEASGELSFSSKYATLESWEN